MERYHFGRDPDVPAKTLKPVQIAREYTAPALDKGLDILELLSFEPVGLTKSEIARRLSRTVSEIFRMLVTLEMRGYISHQEGDRYSLTLRLFRMVQQHPPTERLLAEAEPVMREMAKDIRQSCHLGIIEGSEVVIIAQANSPTNTGFYVKLGSTVDLMQAATGQVILAYLNPLDREQVLTEWKAKNKRIPPRDLTHHLKRIREKGVEERKSYQVKGVLNVSRPILGNAGCAVAALTVPFIERLHEPITLASVSEQLAVACSRISEAIGTSSAGH
jgi:DNA-binding IclR family transcriptional regulator